MYRDGHAGFNALLYAPFVPLITASYSLETALWGAVVTLAAANLPDLDQSLERIDHRGPTHTIWFALLFGFVAGLGTMLVARSGFGSSGGFGFGFVIGTCGILAHLAGDVVTPMGISPFEPVSQVHVTLAWFKSKNGLINRTFLVIGTFALVVSVLLTVVQQEPTLTSMSATAGELLGLAG
ncbi:membrane-bound metal-dependent hydrolase [Natrinema pellirubrum DSM 15624]|uniref:Membrane-bound metal-dependent hydrolase n=1 Tax=Natrinema pellirubrum (strain DSM 15624 / CIP 106293 / JCM 10476 / NCIMB 786 / 157) TaxID=797303 RepID=L0JME1_NATP1|nr:metal-dependent hydrolase [Natrinema pellirubrum]AGB32003.1 putative membrane-bound metal-dependent hydrolase [Natrinema pellirubrum DSM 15624]ELY78130.1 membrane-bound metal-dependent hydrolase [Natrinema pellirubrum DSM 15624]